jgi:hypothetical protein
MYVLLSIFPPPHGKPCVRSGLQGRLTPTADKFFCLWLSEEDQWGESRMLGEKFLWNLNQDCSLQCSILTLNSLFDTCLIWYSSVGSELDEERNC